MFVVLAFGLISFNYYYQDKWNSLKESLLEKNNFLAKEIARQIYRPLLKGNVVDAERIVKDLNHDKMILYALFFDGRGKITGGYLNDGSDLLKVKDVSSIKNGRLISAENILIENFFAYNNRVDLLRVKFARKIGGKDSILGSVTLGVSLPFELPVYFLLTYPWLLYALGAVFFSLGLFVLLSRMGKKTHPLKKGRRNRDPAEVRKADSVVMSRRDEKMKTDEDGADLLSMDVDRSEDLATEEYSQTDLVDLKNEDWINLFNGWDLDEWERNGSWYVSNGVIVGSPWQASLVREDIGLSDYEFEFKAKKITGTDGFVVIFKCSEKNHAWIVGGWRGKKSEVINVRETATAHGIESGRWYSVKVTVLPETVKGYLNGDEAWSVSRALLENAPSQKHFPAGIGVGLWNTMCKFKELRLTKR